MARSKKATKKTYVALVLDESGSMSSIREQAISLFNEQRDTIISTAKKGGDTKLSFFKFGGNHPNETVEVFHGIEPEKCDRLTEKSYIPQNGTPMRDGIGLAITRLEKEDDGGKDTAFLVVVVTDGQENQSREWSADRMRTKVSELQGTGRWTFAVYGANISLADLQDTGVPVLDGNYAAYQASPAGVLRAASAMAFSTVDYMTKRAVGQTSTKTFTK